MKKHLTYIILAIISLILNAFMCNMSPLRDCLFCSDVNCFYMEGKAWALGYVPYVDFIDSKGPILFLIFAAGYLISPDYTFGVFLLASASTFATLIFVYKIAFHYTESVVQSLFVTSCCASALFFKPYYGYGPRTEQFLLPFVSWIIYFFTTKTRQLHKSDKLCTHLGIGLGISTAVFLLTKYIYTIFPIVAFLCSIIILNQSNSKRRAYLLISGLFSLSFLLICLPFLIYFSLTNSFDDFIWSYFQLSANLSTPNAQSGIGVKLLAYATIIKNNTFKDPAWYGSLISLIFLGTAPCFKKDTPVLNRMLCITVFFSHVTCCSLGLYSYYKVLYFPLYTFTFIALLKWKSVNNTCTAILSVLILALSIPSHIVAKELKREKRASLVPAEWCRNYSEAEEIIKSKYRAKILYMDQLGQGFGIRTGAVPACPSWFSLTYAGCELLNMRKKAIRDRIPDFVFTYHGSPHGKFLKEAGYESAMTILEGSQMQNAIELWRKTIP